MSPFKSCMCTKANTSPKSVLSLIDQSVSNQDDRIFLQASGLEIFCRLQWSAKSRLLPLFHGDVGNLSSVDDPTAGQSSVRRHETSTASSRSWLKSRMHQLVAQLKSPEPQAAGMAMEDKGGWMERLPFTIIRQP